MIIVQFWLSENYFIHGNEEGKYALISPILRESGKRWFYPHFGFAYKAINTKVKVFFVFNTGGSVSKLNVLDR